MSPPLLGRAWCNGAQQPINHCCHCCEEPVTMAQREHIRPDMKGCKPLPPVCCLHSCAQPICKCSMRLLTIARNLSKAHVAKTIHTYVIPPLRKACCNGCSTYQSLLQLMRRACHGCVAEALMVVHWSHKSGQPIGHCCNCCNEFVHGCA